MIFSGDNFVGNMYGPHFLAFYALVIGFVLALGRWWVWSADRTLEEPLDDPPEPADPIDVALLRGEVNEVLRLTVVELVQRRFLHVEERRFLGMTTGQKIARSLAAPDLHHLSPLQRAVFDFFRTPNTAAGLFADSQLKQWFQVNCLDKERRLEEYGLITPGHVKQRGDEAVVVAALVVLGLGGYKLMVALEKGRTNVGFLIVMGLIGTVAAISLIRAPRMSRRGKAYLKKLQARYSRLKSGLTSLTQAVDDSALIFAVALFGIPVLEGTPYATLVSTFRQAGSGSGGCGGGGCGGGGCGGGGCGGCGGG